MDDAHDGIREGQDALGMEALARHLVNEAGRDDHDPTLKCIPTAFGTLNVSMFDVGAVAQIVATPRFVIFLTETFHGSRIRANRRPAASRGGAPLLSRRLGGPMGR